MDERKPKKGHKLFVGVFLSCIMFGILAVYANMLQKELNGEIIVILKEVAEQSVGTVNREVEGEFLLLTEVADRLSMDDTFNPEIAVDKLKEIVKRHSFKRMGITMPDGTSYATDGKNIRMDDKDFFIECMEGRETLSGKIKDHDGEDIMVFCMPLHKQEEVHAVLFATYRVEEMQKLLAVSAFGGKGYSYVVERNGDAVIDTISPIGFLEFKNLFQSLKDASTDNITAASQIKQGMEQKKTGHIMFNNKINKYMYYSPLGINDWYVLNVVPTDFMDSTRNFVMLNTYLLCIVLAVICIAFILYIFRIEQQKKKELSNVLYVDGVTGGYSFARFTLEAQEILRNSNSNAAYIMMDIDKFKLINEIFGYEEGNKMLRYIWGIWNKCCRENEIFARRIADRFIVLWFYNTREELDQRLESVMDMIQKNMPEKMNEYTLKVSMGIYIIKDKNEDVQNMMNYAVMAHSSIKDQDDQWHAFYDDDFREKLLQNKILEDQMKRALKRKEFVVYYQPKYSTMTKEMVGAEALVRWKKADGSTVMPGHFIPLAEQNGFINHLDKYVFKEVCKAQKLWLEEGKKVVPVSVNLSRRHFYNGDFMKEYQDIVFDSGISEKYVQLELTESAVFENQEALCQIIDNLHTMGFHILVDDFGTGYSSLMMLKSIPIDTLKLDKSFVDDFDHPKGEKIIKSVIQLAQALNIEVTAEGVETQEQYEFLKTLGCNTIQGFFFARPMPEDDFEELLNAGLC